MVNPFPRRAEIALFIYLIGIPATNGAQLSSENAPGIAEPDEYAALLAKAAAGTLRISRGDVSEEASSTIVRSRARVTGSEIFPPNAYRSGAKTSFAAGRAHTFSTLDRLFNPLPTDAKMTGDFPALAVKTHNNSARIDLETRNVKVKAWVYWVGRETDHDFHVLLGSTAQLTSTTIFMNSEVSGLPRANPTKSPFAQCRATIRAILATHHNLNGLFDPPVPVTVRGSLLWDGEHRFPNTVGPEGLQPMKAWEIHPIKQLSKR
jgi:hypothetical protein